ncbi:hypothetical protein PQR68_34640 [Paraburkholderia agricolaris]|uniref:hypothetical protein n=1 Tax=Paraburkholderia agricolaris TaxID=2152888 RepID=UPI0038B952AB
MARNEPNLKLRDLGTGVDGTTFVIDQGLKGLQSAYGLGALVVAPFIVVLFLLFTSAADRALFYAFEKGHLFSYVTFHGVLYSADRFRHLVLSDPEKLSAVTELGWIAAGFAVVWLIASLIIGTPVLWLYASLGKDYSADQYLQGVQKALPGPAEFNELMDLKIRGLDRQPTHLMRFLRENLL